MKKQISQSRKDRFINLAVSTSPIQREVRDLREVMLWWTKAGKSFVPYATSNRWTAHATLDFLLNLSEMSPTASAIINSTFYVGMGGPFEISERYDPDWNLGERQIVKDQRLKRYMYDAIDRRVKFFLNTMASPVKPKEFMRLLKADYQRTGNAFVEEASYEVNGEVFTHYFLKPQQNCLYLANQEVREIAINPLFCSPLYRESETEVLPVNGAMIEDENGIMRTVHHYKSRGDWYGRPEDTAVIPHKYLEWQIADYLNVKVGAGLVGDVVFRMTRTPFVTADPNGAYDEADELVENLLQYTNESGDPLGFIVMTDPQGVEPSTVTQLNPITDGEFYEKKATELRHHICVSNGWSARLLGITEASGLSTNLLIDEFRLRSGTTVQALHGLYGGILNDLLYRNFLYNDESELMELTVDFSSPYQNMLNESAGQMGGQGGNAVG